MNCKCKDKQAEANIHIWDYVKLKVFCHSKKMIITIKVQELGETLYKPLIHKDLLFRIYKTMVEIYKNNEKQQFP